MIIIRYQEGNAIVKYELHNDTWTLPTCKKIEILNTSASTEEFDTLRLGLEDFCNVAFNYDNGYPYTIKAVHQ